MRKLLHLNGKIARLDQLFARYFVEDDDLFVIGIITCTPQISALAKNLKDPKAVIRLNNSLKDCLSMRLKDLSLIEIFFNPFSVASYVDMSYSKENISPNHVLHLIISNKLARDFYIPNQTRSDKNALKNEAIRLLTSTEIVNFDSYADAEIQKHASSHSGEKFIHKLVDYNINQAITILIAEHDSILSYKFLTSLFCRVKNIKKYKIFSEKIADTFRLIGEHGMSQACKTTGTEAADTIFFYSIKAFNSAIESYKTCDNKSRVIECKNQLRTINDISSSKHQPKFRKVIFEKAKIILYIDEERMNLDNILKFDKKLDSPLRCILFFSDSKKIDNLYKTLVKQSDDPALNKEIIRMLSNNDKSIFGLHAFDDHPLNIAQDMETLLSSEKIFKGKIAHIFITQKPLKSLTGENPIKTQYLITKEIISQLRLNTYSNFALEPDQENISVKSIDISSKIVNAAMISFLLYEIKQNNERKEFYKSCNLLIKIDEELQANGHFLSYDLPLAKLCFEVGNALYADVRYEKPEPRKDTLRCAMHILDVAQSVFTRRKYYANANETTYTIAYCYLLMHELFGKNSDKSYLEKAKKFMSASETYFKKVKQDNTAKYLKESLAKKAPINLLLVKVEILINIAKNLYKTKNKTIDILEKASLQASIAKKVLSEIKINSHHNKNPKINLINKCHITFFHINYKLALLYRESNINKAFDLMCDAESSLLLSTQKNDFQTLASINKHLGLFLNEIERKGTYNLYLKKAYGYFKRCNMPEKAKELINEYYKDNREAPDPIKELWCKLAYSEKILAQETILQLVNFHEEARKHHLTREFTEDDKKELNDILYL